MTNNQKKHLEYIQKSFVELVGTKYRKGAKEHGGNLFDLSQLDLVEAAIGEAIDQFTYLWTLYQKLLLKGNNEQGIYKG